MTDTPESVEKEQPQNVQRMRQGVRGKKKGAFASVVAEEFNVRQAMGGARGVTETIIPPLLFVLLYLVTGTITIPAVAALVISLGAIVVRLIQKIDVAPALSGFLVVGISVVWALKSGQASNYFTLGLFINATCLCVLLIFVILRRPFMGLLIGSLRGDITGWKKTKGSQTPEQRLTRRRYWHITWLWVGLFAVRLLVQVPLFYADAIASLAAARIVMGPFLFAFVAWLTWMIVRSLPPVPASVNADDEKETNQADIQTS